MRPRFCGGCASALIEDWIHMRATLQRQLEALESGQITTGDAIVGSTTEDTIIRNSRQKVD